MRLHIAIAALLFFAAFFAMAQKRLPIIDMHLHALHADDQGEPPVKIGAPFTNWDAWDPKAPYGNTFMQVLKTGSWSDSAITSPLTDEQLQKATLDIMHKYNVHGVASGPIDVVRKWKKAAPDNIMNAVYWNYYDAKKQGLNVDSLTKLFKSGEFKVFGEVGLQYEGISPSDSLFEPYLKMAETLDIPVGVHIGPGPPGVIYLGANNYRASMHSATVLEEALVKHPKLRLYAMHAGWPMLDDMLATLYAHPQLYVDLGLICYAIPKEEFYFYLKRLVNAGFGKRIMFGSDNMVWPQAIFVGIQSIEKASFLTAAQKRDILFNNAARFLRLSNEEITRMQAASF